MDESEVAPMKSLYQPFVKVREELGRRWKGVEEVTSYGTRMREFLKRIE